MCKLIRPGHCCFGRASFDTFSSLRTKEYICVLFPSVLWFYFAEKKKMLKAKICNIVSRLHKSTRKEVGHI